MSNLNDVVVIDNGSNSFFISKEIDRTFRTFLDRTSMAFHSYQLDGVKWCVHSETNTTPLYGVRGGFIADEMGLGKTIMMIGTMICNKLNRTLIVVPVILIEQWYNQIYKTTGHKSFIYYGNKKKKCVKSDLENAVIVITSYAHISLKKKNKKNGKLDKKLDCETTLLHEIKWSRVVFDEAHHLRNSGTGRNSGSLLLKTDITWLISGTPIQNSRRDFYHLCSTLKIPSFETENIPEILERFVLRRSKKDVGIDCGELNVSLKDVKWSKKKEMNLSLDVHSFLAMNREFKEAILSKESSVSSPFENKRTLELYLRAKQSCILPSLMGRRLVGKDLWKSNYSSKIDAVVSCILNKKDNGNGKLVFCSYRFEMDTIAKKLEEGGVVGIQILDGRITGSARKKCLNELALYSVLIIQIQTGCEGLNLQEYFNEVYFVSPNWNPSVEDQAIARCYRIGQKKKVFVYKFVMMNDCVSDQVIDLLKTLDPYLIKMIVEYIPSVNMKWINMDEYIVSIQGMKREMIKEFIL
jgi:SNF2 family DNA or RNA helicase